MNILTRFPTKLATIFLVLVVVSGAANVLISLRIFEERQIEIDQRLNVDVATNMASELEPLIRSTETDAEIGSAIHYMMVMNPSVEIYLLDHDGAILDYFASPGPPVQLDRVDTVPVEAFLSEEWRLPILGDNPRRPEQRHHFSAASIELGAGRTGYLYVVLRSSEYDAASMMLQRRYLLQALLTSTATTIPIVALLGLLVFFLSTRPLQRLSRTVAAFGSGAYETRSAITTRDEVGDLARNFNTMAQTIVANVKRLEYADRERRELIANISHDLRNPLATVQGYLERLAEHDDTLTPEERRHYYEILLGAIRSVPRLVEDLFELSKLDAPDMRPQMEPFSMSELVQDVVVQWKSRAAEQGIELIADRPDGLNLVRGNVGLIERVLTNLVRNALTHTPEGGDVRITVARSDSCVRVTVRDTGCGINPESLPRVFDRFYIGDKSRSRSRDGSGLGLAICKRIVDLHHGTIGVESEPGSGSTFHFELDIAGDSPRD